MINIATYLLCTALVMFIILLMEERAFNERESEEAFDRKLKLRTGSSIKEHEEKS